MATSIIMRRNVPRTPPMMYIGMLFTRRTPAFFPTAPGDASGAICSLVSGIFLLLARPITGR
ncbi:hypothetical protein, partial [Thiolapillus sp.]|uniref:hypothetical protein n=1 Tax=Thiolapillus sp. TaxID=2017437 RepID=UPI003AF461BD